MVRSALPFNWRKYTLRRSCPVTAVSMAIANHVLFTPTISSSFSSSKHPQLKLSAKRYPSALTPCGKSRCLGFSLSSYRPVMPSSRLTLSLSAAAYSSVKSYDNDGQDGEDGVQMPGEDDQEQSLSLTTLIDAYKKALFSDDESMLTEIEAKIYKIEKEKQELCKKLSLLSTEMSSGKVNYIRLQADFDNFRKRSDKEKLSITTNARREVIKNFLTVVDDFEKTKKQVRPETEKEKKIDTSFQGIYKQFVEVMRNFNVSAVATVGKPFDPSVHEAISREPSQEFKEGIIIRELQRGFLLKDQLLRPAKVMVSSGPGVHKAKTAATLDSDGTGVDER